MDVFSTGTPGVLYLCTATNTWTAVSTGGSSGPCSTCVTTNTDQAITAKKTITATTPSSAGNTSVLFVQDDSSTTGNKSGMAVFGRENNGFALWVAKFSHSSTIDPTTTPNSLYNPGSDAGIYSIYAGGDGGYSVLGVVASAAINGGTAGVFLDKSGSANGFGLQADSLEGVGASIVSRATDPAIPILLVDDLNGRANGAVAIQIQNDGLGTTPFRVDNIGVVTSEKLAFHDSSTGAAITYGIGAPVGACITGSIYLRTDGTTDTSQYTCQNAVWVALAAAPAAGANTALSNLASVAVNTSLLPGADASIDLGSSSKRWRDAYLSRNALVADGSKAAPTLVRSAASTTGFYFTSAAFGFAIGGVSKVLCAGGCTFPSDGTLSWSSTTDAEGTADSVFKRTAANQVRFTNASDGFAELEIGAAGTGTGASSSGYIFEATGSANSAPGMTAQISNTSATRLVQLRLLTGNGTSSGRNSQIHFVSSETSSQDWGLGMPGSTTFTLTNGANTPLTVSSANTITLNGDAAGGGVSGKTGIGVTASGNGVLQIQPDAAASTRARVGGGINDQGQTTGNTAATETDLRVVTLDAGMMNAIGDIVTMKVGGTFAATGSTDKQIQIYLGSNHIFDTGSLAITTASSWAVEANCQTTDATAGNSTIKCWTTLITSSTVLPATTTYSAVTGLTLTSSLQFKITGKATNSDDVVAEVSRYEWGTAP